VRLDRKSALGIVLSALLLWWTLHDQPLGAVWAAVRASDWWLWAASTVSATLIFRCARGAGRTILEPVARASRSARCGAPPRSG
jgi:hypothetical protein